MITESKKFSPPPWEKDALTFYITGFGYLFEARMKDILKTEYDINLKFQETKYLNMEHVLDEFGLPTDLVEGQNYFWDYRDDECVYLSIDFIHEKVIIDCNGDEINCVCISFQNIPESQEKQGF